MHAKKGHSYRNRSFVLPSQTFTTFSIVKVKKANIRSRYALNAATRLRGVLGNLLTTRMFALFLEGEQA